MPELESEGAAWKSGVWSVLTVVAVVSALLFNITAFVLTRTRKLRRPVNFPLACLAIFDACAAVLWLLPSVAAASSWSWSLGAAMCDAQAFFSLHFFIFNMYTLTAISCD